MAEYYVDASSGSDANAGTSGAPFATIQKALDSSTGGDIINLSNSAAFVLSAQLNFTAFGATTRDTPLLIRSWDNGGSITIQKPTVGGVAQSIVAAEIDGDDAVVSLFAATDKWIIFQGLKLHSTTGIVINRIQGWAMYNCEVYDGSGQYLVGTTSADAHCIDNYVHDDGGTGVDGIQVRQGTFTGNYVKNVSGNGIIANATTYNTIINNVVDGFGESGIVVTTDGNSIIHNTVNDYTGSGTGHGIEIRSGAEFTVVLNNIITNVDGSGSGVYITSGANNVINGPNAFYNNTTNNGGATNPASCIDLTGDDVSESSSPYEDEAGGDFRIATTSGAYEEVLAFGGEIATKSNFGAFSPGKEATSGGGGGTTDTNGPLAWNDGVSA
jgi:hypothetical protein